MATIGILNPGAMGASVAAAAAGNGHRVLWAGAGRSAATRDRAEQAGLEDCDTVERMASEATIILSVCPPESARAVASDVIGAGFTGLFVDGNAISPDQAREIETMFTTAGARFVDGGIIGGPAWKVEYGTVLHLSGGESSAIADLFTDSPLHTSIVSEDAGAASALKMVYAAYTKGTTALLAAILGVAEREGVRTALEKQWGAEFTEQTHRRVAFNTAKAWRFVGEMEEIAATFAGAGLPDGFHLAAADTYSRLSRFKNTETPDIHAVLAALLEHREK